MPAAAEMPCHFADVDAVLGSQADFGAGGPDFLEQNAYLDVSDVKGIINHSFGVLEFSPGGIQNRAGGNRVLKSARC